MLSPARASSQPNHACSGAPGLERPTLVPGRSLIDFTIALARGHQQRHRRCRREPEDQPGDLIHRARAEPEHRVERRGGEIGLALCEGLRRAGLGPGGLDGDVEALRVKKPSASATRSGRYSGEVTGPATARVSVWSRMMSPGIRSARRCCRVASDSRPATRSGQGAPAPALPGVAGRITGRRAGGRPARRSRSPWARSSRSTRPGAGRPGGRRAAARGLLVAERLAATPVLALESLVRPSGTFGSRRAGCSSSPAGCSIASAAISAPCARAARAAARRGARHSRHRSRDGRRHPALFGGPAGIRRRRVHPASSGSSPADVRRAGHEEARRWLEAHLPSDPDLFNEFHALLVAVAKSHCRTGRSARAAHCASTCAAGPPSTGRG